MALKELYEKYFIPANLDTLTYENMPKQLSDKTSDGDRKRATIDDFEVIKIIEEHNWSKIMSASSKRDNKLKVCLKCVKNSPIAGKFFVQEIIILNSVQNKRIITIYDAFFSDGTIYMVMELAEKLCIYRKIPDKCGFPEDYVAKLTIEIVKALQHCHNKGIVHADIKPENIVIFRDGKIKLIDFGHSYRGETRTQFGTVGYFAPEIVMKNICGKMVDIWALGVTIFRLASDTEPFENEDEDDDDYFITKLNIKYIRYEIPAKFSPELASLLKSIFVMDPNSRIKLHEILSHPWITKFAQN